MMGLFTQTTNNQIQRAQTAELSLLSTDKTVAKNASMDVLYHSLGEWISTENGEKVLELGCGPGKFVAMLSTLDFQVTGVDPFEFPTWAELEGKSNVSFKKGVYAETLPYQDGEFDHVTCLNAMQYFADPSQALKEIYRVLKQGGRLVINTQNKQNLYVRVNGKPTDPAMKNLYTVDELRELLEANGFRVEKICGSGFWPPIFTNTWHYLNNVWLSKSFRRWASTVTPEKYRSNILVFAQVHKKDAAVQKNNIPRVSE